MAESQPDMLEELLGRYRQGDRRALARLLSLAARGQHLSEIDSSQSGQHSPSRVIAITGSAGVGKSTLVGKLIEHLRQQKLSVAVLACDPESPVSGGALLGDRFRMPSQPDEGVFIRSLATAEGHGAVAENLPMMIRLLEGFGFDVVILETVGAGQGDTTVRELADVVVLLLQPEAGDELQWEKAGVLEVADVVVIQKADLPGAESTEAQVRNILGLSSNPAAPILRVSARAGTGIDPLWQTIAAAPLRRTDASRNGAELLRRAQQQLATLFRNAENSPAVARVVERYRNGEITSDRAAAELLRALAAVP